MVKPRVQLVPVVTQAETARVVCPDMLAIHLSEEIIVRLETQQEEIVDVIRAAPFQTHNATLVLKAASARLMLMVENATVARGDISTCRHPIHKAVLAVSVWE